jgi:hypothetical protein
MTSLTLPEQAIFVVDALSRLPHPDDLAEGADHVELCCPDCCAPCGVLRDLLESGRLDAVVAQAPPEMGIPGYSWMRGGRVNTDWLRACWACVQQPPCSVEPDEETELCPTTLPVH